MKHIILYGGSFNPPTKAHYYIAQSALRVTAYDAVYFLPCSENPTNDKSLVDGYTRLQMIEAGMNDVNHANMFALAEHIILDCAYTVDVIKEIYRKYNLLKYKFYFLMSTETATEIETWKDSDQLKKMIPFIVVDRSGYDADIDAWFRKFPHRYHSIESLETQYGKVSSTAARDCIKRSESVVEYLHPSVINYIVEHGLYK